jgi:biotin carboxyl carrier protein
VAALAGAARDEPQRDSDHAAIGRLADDLLPALIAKLGASGLGEIEVREGAWRVRLRRTSAASGGPDQGRRATDRPSRPQPGHAGHGHAPAAIEGHRAAGARDGRAAPAPVGPGRPTGATSGVPGDGAEAHRAVATSPAVGIFQPRPEMRPGTRIRVGDRLGAVDVLGVLQEISSPVDGVVGATLVEAGDAVEYGQELIRLELARPVSALHAPGAPPPVPDRNR